MLKRVFGRKPPSPSAILTVADDRMDAVKLSIDDMVRYVRAGAERRGYPDDSLDMIARRVAFLERRGLPGFAAFIREMSIHSDENLHERAVTARANGQQGGHCPIIAGAMLDDALGQAAAAGVGQIVRMAAPSNPVLLLPKLAEYAGPRGLVLMLIFYDKGQEAGRSFADGHRAVHFGPVDPLFECEAVGFGLCAEEWLDEVKLRGGHVDASEFPASLVSRLIRFIEDGQ